MVRDLIHRIAEWVGRRSRRVADAAGAAAAGHRRRPTRAWSPSTARAAGWRSSGPRCSRRPSHANKLLAGYVALRALGIHANFVDILLVQTLVMFLLYFAPTPGASGIGEVLSAAVMCSYVPRELTPIYILIWRLILTYFTLGFGFFVFSSWVRQGPQGRRTTAALAEPAG